MLVVVPLLLVVALSLRAIARQVSSSSACYWMAAAGAASVITVTAASTLSIERTSLDAPASLSGPPVKEAKTGILFPAMEGSFSFVGCGVRVKYGFVKVCHAWPCLSVFNYLNVLITHYYIPFL